MNRANFRSLSWALRKQHPSERGLSIYDTGYASMEVQWTRCVYAIAEVCAEFNPRFDHDMFLMAAGETRRDDGTMFPMRPPERRRRS